MVAHDEKFLHKFSKDTLWQSKKRGGIFLEIFFKPEKNITRLGHTYPVNTQNKRVSYLRVNFALFDSHHRKPPF